MNPSEFAVLMLSLAAFFVLFCLIGNLARLVREFHRNRRRSRSNGETIGGTIITVLAIFFVLWVAYSFWYEAHNPTACTWANGPVGECQ